MRDADLWGAMVMSVRDNTEVRVYVGFESEEPHAPRDVAAQKRLVAERFADAGWETPRLLKSMGDAPDFHFDAMAQVHMDAWSRGRVTLLGDAGYCGSPASGQGTSMALVGAYVLAGELRAADGDHEVAFAAYEHELRDYVAADQRLAYTQRPPKEARDATETGVAVPGAADVDEVVGSLRLKDH
jgi:2-polyprenyl-6-methoxyphenol hydroxylase-like FAD-dependent oxidoreductase